MSQKASSEILGNWLIAVLGEYAYDGNMSDPDGYTTSFNSDMSGNYPTIGNLTLDKNGKPDTSTFPATVNGSASYPLSALKDSNGNELYPLTFNGNWQIGYKALNADGSFSGNADSFTPYGVYVYGANKTLWFAGDASNLYGSTGGMRISTTPNGSQMISSTTSVSSGGVYTSVSWKNDTTIRYTAEYDGKITISVKDLLFNNDIIEMTVLKNGEVIGSVKADKWCSASVVDGTGAGTVTSAGAGVGIGDVFETSVSAGDHIDFVNHHSEDEFTLTTENYGTCKDKARYGVTNFRLRVTYSSVVTATTDIDADYSGKTDALNWTKPAVVGNLESFLTWYKADGTAITGTLTSLSGATAKINQDLIKAGWIKANDTWENAIEGYFNYLRSLSSVTSPSGWIIGALEGDTPFTNDSGTNFSPVNYYQIFKNTFNLFSVSTTGTYNNQYATDRKMATSESYFEAQLDALRNAASLLPESEVGKVASEIEIPYDASFATTLTAKGYAICPPNWGSGPLSNASTIVDFGNKFQSSTLENTDYIGTLLLPYAGGVTTLSYIVPDNIKEGTATLTLNNLYGLDGWDKVYRFSIYLVSGGTETALIETMEITPSAAAAAVAEINEKLTSFDIKAGDRIDLRFSRKSSAVYVSPDVSLDIEINSQDSIPMHRVQYVSGGNVLNSQLAEVGTSIANLISIFRQTNKDFAANGCYVNGVWYSENAELPIIGDYDVVIDDFKVSIYSSIGIGATYAMNAYLPTVDGATAAGVKVNGEKIPATLTDGMYKATVSTVYAKDLLDATVYVTPYYVIGNKEVVGQGTTLRAADMLKTYIGDGYYAEEVKALAQAALDYATVAKAYFAGETADAATLARLAAYDTAINGETAGKLNKTGDIYTFTAATLQIGETINFVLAIGNKDGSALKALPEGTTLTIPGKTETTAFTAATVNGQSVQIAVIEGVPEKEFAVQQTFSLLDANDDLLASMTYGVKDYCVRAFASADAAEANMIRAVYAIGKAAAAYEASTNGDAGETEKVSLDGKKVIFCGNSHIYWGRAVIGGSGNDLTKRNNDQGTFYQLCKAFGQDVNVTNWTFGSHGLSESFGPDACGGRGGCANVNGGVGEIHEQYLTDRWYDYVIISPGSRYTDSGANFMEDIQYLIDFFTNEEKGGNPNVKFVCVGNMSPYGYSNLKEDLRVLVANNYKVLEEDGFIISDWGSIVYDVLQKGAVDGGNATYTDSTFVVKDGFHPNMLSGYINALTTFCAITGESPVGMPFPSDLLTAENNAKLDIDAYLADTTNNYKDPSDTNMKEILADDGEIRAIQEMIARYLEAKPYRDFDFE